MSFDRKGFDREVGLRLQNARKRRGMTQGHLSERIGIQRASYANLEAGRQRIPIDVVWRAAVVLGISISTLVPEPTLRAVPTLASQEAAADGTVSTAQSIVDLVRRIPATQ